MFVNAHVLASKRAMDHIGKDVSHGNSEQEAQEQAKRNLKKMAEVVVDNSIGNYANSELHAVS